MGNKFNFQLNHVKLNMSVGNKQLRCNRSKIAKKTMKTATNRTKHMNGKGSPRNV